MQMKKEEDASSEWMKLEAKSYKLCSVSLVCGVRCTLCVFFRCFLLFVGLCASANGNGEADRIINNENYRCSKY